MAQSDPAWLEGVELKPSYAGGVGLILERRCVQCHRPGEIAPMPFTTYEEARQWIEKSYTPLPALIQERGMPPWPADPDVGAFSNTNLLTPREVKALNDWVDLGFPRGSGDFAPAIEWVEGWNIGKPDAVFELPEYTVPEDVDAEYHEFTVETNFPEDRWIIAAEARPGDPALVMAIDGGPLGAYQPGNTFVEYPDGYGRLLKAGESITVRVHYVKEKGYTLTDKSVLGVRFASDDAPRKDVLVAPMQADAFTVPAGDAVFEVNASFTFESEGEILSLMPVMHLRGHSVSTVVKTPDGEEQTILSIPRWDPNWKFRYQLAEPIQVPKGTIVELRAIFDNSTANLKNPNPEAEITSCPDGETLEGWLHYTISSQ